MYYSCIWFMLLLPRSCLALATFSGNYVALYLIIYSVPRVGRADSRGPTHNVQRLPLLVLSMRSVLVAGVSYSEELRRSLIMTVCSQIGAFLVPDYPLGNKFLKSGAAILLGSHGGCIISSSPAGSVCLYMISRMCISVSRSKSEVGCMLIWLFFCINLCITYR